MVYEDVFEAIRSINPRDEILKVKEEYVKHGARGYITRSNMYQTLNMGDGTFCAFTSLPWDKYYRGENRFFKDLTPSMFRKNKSPNPKIELIRDQIKLLDFYDITAQFPQVQLAIADHMRVDLQALAQHYGLKTHFVDISSELVIAAFFATHEFRAGDFYPITQGYGYIKIISFMPFLGDSLDKNFQMIGLQPFLRPGLQCAFALKPNLDGKNHYHIRTIKFKQTYFCKVLGWIFRSQQKIEDPNKKSYTDHNILFPKEEICVPAELIRNSNSVTKTNLIKYCEKNMLNIDQLQQEFCTSGIKITEEPLYSLSPRRQDELFREYEGRPYGDAMLSPPRLIG